MDAHSLFGSVRPGTEDALLGPLLVALPAHRRTALAYASASAITIHEALEAPAAGRRVAHGVSFHHIQPQPLAGDLRRPVLGLRLEQVVDELRPVGIPAGAQ